MSVLQLIIFFYYRVRSKAQQRQILVGHSPNEKAMGPAGERLLLFFDCEVGPHSLVSASATELEVICI